MEEEEKLTQEEQIAQLEEFRAAIAIDGLVGDDNDASPPDPGEPGADEDLDQDEQIESLEENREIIEQTGEVGDDSGVEDPPMIDYEVFDVSGEVTEEHKAIDPSWQENIAELDTVLDSGGTYEEVSSLYRIPIYQLKYRKFWLFGIS